jgi:hypothetical protein
MMTENQKKDYMRTLPKDPNKRLTQRDKQRHNEAFWQNPRWLQNHLDIGRADRLDSATKENEKLVKLMSAPVGERDQGKITAQQEKANEANRQYNIFMKKADTQYQGLLQQIEQMKQAELTQFQYNKLEGLARKYETAPDEATARKRQQQLAMTANTFGLPVNVAKTFLAAGDKKWGFGAQQREEKILSPQDRMRIKMLEEDIKNIERDETITDLDLKQSMVNQRRQELTQLRGKAIYPEADTGGYQWGNMQSKVSRSDPYARLPSPTAQTALTAPTPTSPAAQAPPAVGEIRDGYRYIGGDPSREESWELVR